MGIRSTRMAPTIANLAAMEAYSSYGLQWLGPIVFPLSFAIPTIAYVLYTFYRTGIKSAADVVSLGITTCEAMFATFCWVQCIANYHNRDMSGGADSCYFQAVYATLYLFTSVMLVALAATVTIVDISLSVAAVATLAVWGAGFCLALLPYMGAGQYRFPKDFCMCDIEDSVYAALWLTAWSTALLLLLAALYKPRAKTSVVGSRPVSAWVVTAAMGLTYLAFFSTPTIISLIFVAKGSQPDVIYGALAIILHTQQVGNPLVYGLLWRFYLNAADAPAAHASLPDKPDPPVPLKSEPDQHLHQDKSEMGCCTGCV